MADHTALHLGPVTLTALEAGHGGRPLLLTHGFTGAKEDFADHVDAFAEQGWWVVAPDLRGHGSSDKPDQESDYSLSIYADDLQVLAAALGWERFSLLGHSMGGMIAQELVLRAPSCVERLVLMDTHHGAVEAIDAETVALGVEVLRTQGLDALLDLMAQLPMAPRAPSDERVRTQRPGYHEFAEGKARRCAAAMYAAMAQEISSRPSRLPELATLQLPVQVVVGEEDRGFFDASHQMAAAIPGAQLSVIPDAAHSPQFENPDAWWAAVGSFLGAPTPVD